MDNFQDSTLQLSIIIPVYNVEEYLRRCVDSILSQDYDAYEIILVDDGSTDNGGVICDELAQQYSHISVIHKSNGGLSSARNAGLKAAKGQYIWFIDSDDYIAEQSLGAIMSQIVQNQAEVIFFSYIRSNGIVNLGSPVGEYHKGFYSGKEILQRQLANISSCSFVSLRILWVNHKLHYREGIYFEDFEIFPKFLKNVQKGCFLNSDISPYIYYSRPGSIMKQSDPEKRMKQIQDFFRIEESWKEWFNLLSPEPNSYDMLMLRMGTNMLHRNLLNFVRNSNFSIFTKLRLYAQYRKKGVFSWCYNGYRRDPYVGRTSIRLFWNTIGRSCILFSLFSIGEEIWKKIKR